MISFRSWIKTALAAVLIAAVGAPSLFGQSLSSLPTFGKTPEHWLAQIVNANTTTNVTIVDCTVGTYGCNNAGAKITSIIASTTDTTAGGNTVELQINNGTETAVLATINVPQSSGLNSSTTPTNLLTLGNIPGLFIDSDGNPVLFITASEKLLINATASVASTKTVSVFTQAAVF